MKKNIKKDMTREQWVIIQDFGSAVMNLNSIFCGDDEYSEEEKDIIVRGLVEKIPGKMPAEDAIEILQRVLRVKEKQTLKKVLNIRKR